MQFLKLEKVFPFENPSWLHFRAFKLDGCTTLMVPKSCTTNWDVKKKHVNNGSSTTDLNWLQYFFHQQNYHSPGVKTPLRRHCQNCGLPLHTRPSVVTTMSKTSKNGTALEDAETILEIIC